jgi:putative tricarboxylic transport membrane protein
MAMKDPVSCNRVGFFILVCFDRYLVKVPWERGLLVSTNHSACCLIKIGRYTTIKEDGPMTRDLRRLRIPVGLLFCVSVFLMLLHAPANGKAADQSDYPSRPIALVTHTAPGGGIDFMCRLISDIIAKEKIFSQSLVVVNKQGSGGAIAYGYVFERKNNPYVIMVVGSNSFMATPLLEKVPYNYKSFTHIANLIFDGSILVVRSDSSYKTADDIIAEARKRPKELIQGGSSFTGNESMMAQGIQKLKGVQWNFISFAGADREALLNVLSGSVHFVFANPNYILDYVRAGKLRVLLACAPNRYPQFKDVPTIKEAGMGEPVGTYRGVVGPPNMPDYAVKKIEVALKKVMDTARFKKYIDDTLMQPAWMSSLEYSKFLDEENDRCKVRLTLIDLLKKK